MIEIKSLYGSWVKVDEAVALEYAQFLYQNILTMKKDELTDYINTKRVRGIIFTQEELENRKEKDRGMEL